MSSPPPPGWYTDPEGHIRWWDGSGWGQATTQPTPAAAAAMRWLPSLVGVVPCIGSYVLVPCLWIWALINLFADDKRQTPFDLCANTVVLTTR